MTRCEEVFRHHNMTQRMDRRQRLPENQYHVSVSLDGVSYACAVIIFKKDITMEQQLFWEMGQSYKFDR